MTPTAWFGFLIDCAFTAGLISLWTTGIALGKPLRWLRDSDPTTLTCCPWCMSFWLCLADTGWERLYDFEGPLGLYFLTIFTLTNFFNLIVIAQVYLLEELARRKEKEDHPDLRRSDGFDPKRK
jgi:hypothetical protein